MIEKQYIQQLKKVYPKYLSDLANGICFSAIRLRGGTKKPNTAAELYGGVDSFLKNEKNDGRLGWVIEWAPWHSKTLGNQRWPTSIWVQSEEDFIYLIGKQKEATSYKRLIEELLGWNKDIAGWIATNPQKVLALQAYWRDLCAVVDYLLDNDVAGYYIRSLPVPVHTKFMQQHQTTLLSILKYLKPERFPENIQTLEAALGLQQKPLLFPIRWLDTQLARQYTSGIEFLSIPAEDLRKSTWAIKEVWLVENETNLFLMPKRKDAVVVFSKGYALHDLKNIPLFHNVRLFYWGDLDEDGFIMLHQFRQHYPHTQSILMDDETVSFHRKELEHISFRNAQNQLNLTHKEYLAYKQLMEDTGRIEQEKLEQAYVYNYLMAVQ